MLSPNGRGVSQGVALCVPGGEDLSLRVAPAARLAQRAHRTPAARPDARQLRAATQAFYTALLFCIACCGTCLEARGLTEEHLIDNAARCTIKELAAWTVEADDVLTF
jgi:sulfur relay (sulfurtransferase) complex TusBCD TusD component (DsrE family)